MHLVLILIRISKPTSGSSAKRLTLLNYLFKLVFFFYLLCFVPANIYKKYKNHYKGIVVLLQTDGKR